MRRLELVILFGSLVAVGWPVVFGSRPRRGIVAMALLASVLAHLRLEGYRWQMIPLYATAVGLAVGDVIFIDRRLDPANRLARGAFGVIGLGVAAALPFALPVPELPVPGGTEAIGTISVELVDREREEEYGPDPGSPRRLMAQVWYPADPATGSGEVIWAEDWDLVAPALSRLLGLPSWFLNHTRHTSSHATASPDVAAGSYPVVLYSHGWTGFRSIAVNQAETLASNGYVVIAPDHTYASVATRFPNGDAAFFDPRALPEPEEVGPQAYEEASEALVDTFSADLVTIIDELAEGESGAFGQVAESVDLGRLGIYGHSTGGGAAIQTCLLDERCDAVLGLDPWVEPLSDRDLRVSPTRPALFMRSDEWRGTPNDSLLRGIAGRSEAPTYWVGVNGAAHNDFVLAPLLTPLADELGLKGPISPGRVMAIVDNYLVGFFDVFLLDTGPAALEAVDFPEVSVEVIGD